MKATTMDAYNLFHEGCLALTRAEINGWCVDVEYCQKQIAHTERRVNLIKKKLQDSEMVNLWKSVYRGDKFNMDSNDQLGNILYNHMGIEPIKWTNDEKTKPSVDEDTLGRLGVPEVSELIEIRKLQKAVGTYLTPYIRESVDGRIHTFYQLHLVDTYRSSCRKPNLQNVPVRNPQIAKMIRRALIPSPGNTLIETDYSGIEVGISCCYHKDPKMVKYVKTDPGRMHTDQAKECYLLAEDEWTKMARYAAKNKFVFPQFYGDYYRTCAMSLWEAITMLNLTTTEGIPMADHLASKGIQDYEDFENHIEKVEHRFWKKKFKVYDAWKNRYLQDYLRKGTIDFLTGFQCGGIMKKNEVLNRAIQGTAFHCLLWSFIQMDKYIIENNMKSRLVGQVHDSMIGDVVPDERNQWLDIQHKIMTEDIREHWDWIIIPLEVEAEETPIDGSWFDKKEIKFN